MEAWDGPRGGPLGWNHGMDPWDGTMGRNPGMEPWDGPRDGPLGWSPDRSSRMDPRDGTPGRTPGRTSRMDPGPDLPGWRLGTDHLGWSPGMKPWDGPRDRPQDESPRMDPRGRTVGRILLALTPPQHWSVCVLVCLLCHGFARVTAVPGSPLPVTHYPSPIAHLCTGPSDHHVQAEHWCTTSPPNSFQPRREPPKKPPPLGVPYCSNQCH